MDEDNLTEKANNNRVLKLAGVVALVIIIAATTAVLYSHYRQYIVDIGKTTSVYLANTIVKANIDLLYHDNVDSKLDINPADIDELNQRVVAVLDSLDILEVKIFDTEGKILYSNNSELIGKIDPINNGLDQALAGTANSILTSKNHLAELFNSASNTDHIETYVPIRNSVNTIIGVIDITTDISEFNELLIDRLSSSMLMLIAAYILALLLAYHMIAGRLRQRQENLEMWATTDALTGLFNRREILNLGHKEFSRYCRSTTPENPNEPFSLLMVDVDQHQEILNKHGHLSGDQVLQQVANHLKASLRGYNTMGRYGGETFMIILPDTDADDASQVGHRLLDAVRNESIITEGLLTHEITLSIGISVVKIGDTGFDDLMRRSDAALYLAKEGGADQVVLRP